MRILLYWFVEVPAEAILAPLGAYITQPLSLAHYLTKVAIFDIKLAVRGLRQIAQHGSELLEGYKLYPLPESLLHSVEYYWIVLQSRTAVGFLACVRA